MSHTYAEKKRLLVVSDDPRILAEIKMELMDAFNVYIAASSSAVAAALETDEMALVVISIGENHERAFELYTEISEVIKEKSVPFIFLAEKGDDIDETRAFKLGAVDFTVRRHGTLDALSIRISLRIHASENEKRISGDEIELMAPLVDPAELLDGKTILVVDDVELNREIIAGILMDVNGLTLDFAEDGKEAVEKFSNTPTEYSLILMDVQMPVMDGMEATKAIRDSGRGNARDVPIIALTADAKEDEVTKYLESGMNGFIQKPMTYDSMMNVVAEYC